MPSQAPKNGSTKILNSIGSVSFVDVLQNLHKEASSCSQHQTIAQIEGLTTEKAVGKPRCEQCIKTFNHSGDTVEAFQNSAIRGCQVCQAILNVVVELRGRPSDEIQPESITTSFPPPFGREDDTFTIKLGLSPLRRRAATFELYVLPGEPSPWPYVTPATDISGDTSSPLALRRAQTWLNVCGQRHTGCPSNEHVSLPTRLLEINFKDDCHTLHLVETRGQLDRYVCLSHCWGDQHLDKIITATIDSYEGHLIDIPWGSLSKTFQDAVEITWRLGLTFVWIDSLCIIQDSKDDWQAEASRMASVYEKSYVTIAASKSRGSQGGCFSTTDTEYLTRSISYSIQANVGSIHVRRPVSHGQEDWPLLTRGWVLQERLLSPRMLHFGPQEIVWECRAGITCECSQSGNSRSSLNTKAHHDEILATGVNPVDFRNRWRDMVGDFCSLDLSFPKDRLPALGGLARQMSQYFHGRYLAGLWEENIIGDLLWFIPHEGQESSPRDEKCCAPTWSWASVTDKGVKYHLIGARWVDPGMTWICDERIVETFVTFLDARCIPLGPDEMGEILEGQITLSALMIAGQLRHLPQLQSESNPDRFDIQLHLLDPKSNSKDTEATAEIIFLPDYNIARSASHYITSGTWVKVIKMAFIGASGYTFGNVFLCLVLHSFDCNADTYERIGLALYSPEDRLIDWFDEAELTTVKLV